MDRTEKGSKKDTNGAPFEAPDTEVDGLDMFNSLIPGDHQDHSKETLNSEEPATESGLTSPGREQTYHEILTRFREKRGQSIQELAHCTRISVEFIHALERGDVECLPGKVFARGFVRSICRSLEMGEADQAELLELFEQHCSADPGDKRQSSRFKPKRSKKSDSRLAPSDAESYSPKKEDGFSLSMGQWKLVAAGCLLVLATITGIYSLKEELSRPPKVALEVGEPKSLKSPEGEPQQLVAVSSGIESDTKEKEVSIMEESVADVAKKAEIPPLAIDAKLHLELTVLNESSVTLILDKQEKQEKVLTPDTYRFYFSDKAELIIKDASSVRVKFNGNDLGVLGKQGQIKKLAFVQELTKKM